MTRLIQNPVKYAPERGLKEREAEGEGGGKEDYTDFSQPWPMSISGRTSVTEKLTVA